MNDQSFIGNQGIRSIEEVNPPPCLFFVFRVLHRYCLLYNTNQYLQSTEYRARTTKDFDFGIVRVLLTVVNA